MAMAIRSMLGKLRNKSSSSCIDRKSMPIMLASSSSINSYRKTGTSYFQNLVLLVVLVIPLLALLMLYTMKSRSCVRRNSSLFLSMYIGTLGLSVTVFGHFKDSLIAPLAFFAVKSSIYKQKNAHLQFVRLVRHSTQTDTCSIFFLTLEAIDDSGEVKVYQAVVYESGGRSMLESEMESDSKKTRRMALILFGLLVDNGNLLKLIDRRNVEVREEPPFEDEVTLYIDDRDLGLLKEKLPRRPSSKYPLEGEILKSLHN